MVIIYSYQAKCYDRLRVRLYRILQKSLPEDERLTVESFSLILTSNDYFLCDAPTSIIFNNCTLCPHCIYVFCIYLRTNSDLCHLQHKLIGFYNRDEKCLQRGTDWGFN